MTRVEGERAEMEGNSGRSVLLHPLVELYNVVLQFNHLKYADVIFLNNKEV